MSVHEDAIALRDDLVRLRRRLHAEPEIGLDLPRTQEKVLAALDGLPLEVSKVSHPEVKGVQWRYLFRSTQDAQYQLVLKWINKLVKPDPNYGFAFSLDSAEVPAGATSAPSPAPAPPPPSPAPGPNRRPAPR